MNCLYTGYIHKDYSVYHAFMHNVKSTCHASLMRKVGCSDCRNILQCSQESQHGGAILWYLELVLDVLSFCMYKAEAIYRFKQSSTILELLCLHTDIFCINSYKCSNYYYFFQVDQYIHLFCKGVYYYIMGVPNPKRREKKKGKILYSFQMVRVNIRHKLGISMPIRLRIILRIQVVTTPTMP